jgi:hypothetical protein
MTSISDIYGTVFKGGTATLLARVVGGGGIPIVQADITQITYSIYLLDDDDADRRDPVPGHDAVSLAVAATITNQLQVDATWTIDPIGYNFRHTPDVSVAAAFPTAGRRYLVEYRLMPAGGQVILVRFRVNAI